MKKSVVEILKDLVAFPSISKTANENIVSYLEDFFQKLNFEVVRIASIDDPKRYNLLCKIGPDVDDGLILSGHMDVVPVAGQNWQSDPFILTEKDGRLIGRGAVDMKGFIAAVCQALANFPRHQIKKPLILLWTYDEEVGCVGSAQAAPLLKNYMHHLPKAVWIGEPTGFDILRMHSGHVTVKISAKGKGAHSSDPDLGISAIKAINRSLNGLFALEEALKTETSYQQFFKRPYVSMNVGQVHGGTAVNIIPDEAHVLLGFRPLPDTSIEAIYDRIIKACLKEQENLNAIISTSIEKMTPAMITQANTKLEAILQPLAHNQAARGAQYSTDGGNLNLAGMESLIYGPGTIDVAHQANEWIDEKDLYLAVENIQKVLFKWL